MSFLAQQSVDDLLAKVQSEAQAVGAAVAEAPAGGAGAGSLPAGGLDQSSPAAQSGAGTPGEFQRLLAIEVPLIVQLGQRRLSVGEVLRLGVGAIVELSKSADEEMDLLVNNKAVGKGHAVKVGENFGIKITQIGSVRETIKKLGGTE